MTPIRFRLFLVCAALLTAAPGCDDGSTGDDDADAPDAGETLDGDGEDAPDDGVPTLRITTEALPDGRVQLPYDARLEASGAAARTVTWTLSAGDLPPGVTLAADGLFSGLPERSGVYGFEVAADDGAAVDTAGLAIAVPPVLLLSGFEPFGEYTINSSWEAILPFDGMVVSGLDVRIVELAVVWGDSWDELAAEIDRLHPAAVIATGQAGPEGMRFETMAANLMHGTDNAGVTMSGEQIVPGGDGRLRADYPSVEMRLAVVAGGFPSLMSSDAGTFLCNYVMYRLLDYHAAAGAEGPTVAGFIHVPPTPAPGAMTVAEITAAHRLGIEALAAWLASGKRARPAVADIHTPPRYFF